MAYLAARPEAAVLRRHLAWRRNVLALVVLATAATAALDPGVEPAGTPPLPIRLGPEDEPAEPTAFGRTADLAWDLSYYALPASALLAAVLWRRPRPSRAALLAGWVAGFLVPVAVALVPWDWWPAGRPPPATAEELIARRYERVAAGVGWGAYYAVMLSPAVLALVPGAMRACVRVKTLLPEAALPGWLLAAAAPLNGLLVAVAFVALAQVAPSPLLVAGLLLWLAAPLAYLAAGGTLTRPVVSPADRRRLGRVRVAAGALGVGAAACLVAHALTGEVLGVRLVGTDPGSSLVRPRQVVRYVLDFAGRSLFVTVLGADLILRATLAAWRAQREFQGTPAAAGFDRVARGLEDALARRPGPGGG
ncbi:MAG: hypothetical protein K2X87_00305 [Gemmataceae bacterium]|nr:hypothetical protein [Gemmataceae bacterium]